MAFDQMVLKDSTSLLIEVMMRDASTGQPIGSLAAADFTVKYHRDGAAAAVDLGAPAALGSLGTWESDKIKETGITGVYQYGVPNACIATAANGVTLVFTGTGAITAKYRIVLTGIDVQDAADIGCTALGYIGTPVALDGGAATLGGMLTKMADDNAGADFNAGTDSLNKLQTSVTAGFPQNDHADAEPGGGTVTTGTNTANDSDATWLDNGTYWQIAGAAADGEGHGLDVRQVFTLGTGLKANSIKVNAKETFATDSVHVWAYNYVTSAYDQLSDSLTWITGSSDANYNYILLSQHQKVADGEVSIRFTTTSTATNQYLYLDQVLVTSVAISELTAAEIATAVWEHSILDNATEGAAGYFLKNTRTLITDVASSVSASSFVLVDGVAVADAYNGMIIVVEDETDEHYEVRRIKDYAADKTVTVDRAFGFTPAAGDDVYLMATGYQMDSDQTGDSYAIVSNATYGNSAIRTRGDAAWTTATGFSTHSAADCATAVAAHADFLKILASACGKVVRTGDVYEFYAANNSTLLFTLTYAAGERTRS